MNNECMCKYRDYRMMYSFAGYCYTYSLFWINKTCKKCITQTLMFFKIFELKSTERIFRATEKVYISLQFYKLKEILGTK